MVKPTVISTFCGTGGSSLGYKWAGFQELLAIDFDSHAVECFKANFPEIPIWHKSITEINGEEILDFCNIKKGSLDVLDGSPPCQGFSTAGKRNINDTRNDLFKHYCRLIYELEPKVFVMENVTGMAKGKMKGCFIEIMKTLKLLSYEVKCKQMNSMYYGVPQSRERLIFIGIRKDLNIRPCFPIPSKNIIPIKNVLNDCPIGLNDGHFTGERLKISKNIKPYRDGSDYKKGTFFNLKRLNWHKPSRTILKSIGKSNSPFGGGLIHPDENRHLTIPECLRIASFPDNFALGNNFQKAWARIGNAVMPKFMQAIAENIKNNILNKLGTQSVQNAQS